MKFTLEIELGNDAMQSAQDVFDAIEHYGDTNNALRWVWYRGNNVNLNRRQ